MARFKITKGLDIKVEGRPSPAFGACAAARLFAAYPSEFEEVKPRLAVQEGDAVRRGGILFKDKKNERLVFRSPCCGTVKSIRLGARRAPLEILIEQTGDDAETFPACAKDAVAGLSRTEVVDRLLDGGLWPLVRQRPFSRIADPEAAPKAVFVNACSSAPFQADFAAVLKGDEDAFQAGLDALSRLTEGQVHLCKPEGSAIPDFRNAQSHTFGGPHPSGNTSIHINRICPVRPGDAVYTVAAQDAILLGKLLLDGEYPRTKVVALGGPAVKAEYRKHYRVPLGGSLAALFSEALEEGKELRIVAGSILRGGKVAADCCVPFHGSEFFVMEEDRSRHVLGWTTPGLFQYTAHRTNLSALPGRARAWRLGTNLHGGRRAMVVTGWLDRHQPLNIMTDFLVRAVLAHDTAEAVQLGILETDPEDFALAAFIDPAKTDLCGIIKAGLAEIEEEGL